MDSAFLICKLPSPLPPTEKQKEKMYFQKMVIMMIQLRWVIYFLSLKRNNIHSPVQLHTPKCAQVTQSLYVAVEYICRTISGKPYGWAVLLTIPSLDLPRRNDPIEREMRSDSKCSRNRGKKLLLKWQWKTCKTHL